MLLPEVKQCPKCKVLRMREEFYVYWKNGQPKFQSRCVACQKAKFVEWWAKMTPEERKATRHARYEAQKHNNAKRYAKDRDNYIRRNDRTRATKKGKLKQLLMSAKERARKFGVPFSIDFAYLSQLWCDQDGRCDLTGHELQIDTVRRREGRFSPWGASLDRIVPKLGYVEGNVRLVATIVNIAMNDFGDGEFAKMCLTFCQNQGWKVSKR